jgi:hypothetical protein
MIDTTLVPVPRQRNTREENKEIMAGMIKEPDGWNENPNRMQKKDLDTPGSKRMASTTTATRIASASMLTWFYSPLCHAPVNTTTAT